VHTQRLILTMLVALLPAAIARAHGEPAAALSIVRRDAAGVQLVSLNEGLALRTDDGFRFVCPAAWGEDFIAPVLAVPEGPAIVGTPSGLFVVDPRGGVSPHPDPMAFGPVTALGASSSALYALLSEADEQRVLQVDAERVRALWSSDRGWTDLVASDGGVHLVGIDGSDLYVARLSDDGALIAEDKATLDQVPLVVRAAMAGDTLYVIVIQQSLDYAVGRIEEGAWLPLESAPSIAGPIETAGGDRYIALDGQLARFDDESVAPLESADFVTCLRTHAGLSYACHNGGLREVGAQGLGVPLFQLEQVIEPELESLPSDRRELCTLQWQRYLIDLQTASMDAGVQEDIDGGSVDAGSVAPTPDAAALDRPRAISANGCAASGHASSGALWVALGLVMRRLLSPQTRNARR
jgi:hypothetical protein